MTEFNHMEGQRVLIFGEVREVHDNGDFWVSIADADNYSAQWISKDSIVCTHADYAALLHRAEAAESELARVKASGIEAMRRAEAAEKELGKLRAERDRLREALERMCNNALELGYCDMGDCCHCKTTAALNGGGE